MRRRFLLTCAVLAGLLPGCAAKLNTETTMELAAGESRTLLVDPVKREQKIYVTLSANAPVDAFVCLESDLEDAKVAFNANKNDKVLVAARKQQEMKLEATIPANSTAAVSVSAPGKSATVKVKINN